MHVTCAGNETAVLGHVAELPPVDPVAEAVAVVAPEFAPSVSVNTTPGTGSPVL